MDAGRSGEKLRATIIATGFVAAPGRMTQRNGLFARPDTISAGECRSTIRNWALNYYVYKSIFTRKISMICARRAKALS